MNLTIGLVIAIVCILVPASLIVAFRASQDTRQYVKHYDARGFSVEECNKNAQRVDNPNGVMVSRSEKSKPK